LESAKIVAHIQNEMALHIDYCKGFGVSKEEMEAAEESEGMHNSPHHVWQLNRKYSACTAYTRSEAQITQLATCLNGWQICT
jgi:thiaminase